MGTFNSHVGRRSLVSNCMLGGINTSSIMLISGHKSLNVFQGYVRVNQQQNAEVLSKEVVINDLVDGIFFSKLI